MLYMTKYQVFTNIQSFKSIIPKFSFINKQNKIKTELIYDKFSFSFSFIYFYLNPITAAPKAPII